MTRFYLIILLAYLGLSCQAIDQSERWMEHQATNTQHGQAQRRILIESYTGQNCINCPSAAKVLRQIEAKFPEHIIVVAMHSEHSRLTRPELASPYAKQLAHTYNLPNAIPGIMLSRHPFADKSRYSLSRGVWAGEAEALIHTARPLSLSLDDLHYDVARDHLSLKVSLKPEALKQTAYRLTLYLVEDIQAEQTTFSGISPNYQHRNVLRDCLTPDGGLQLQPEAMLHVERTGLNTKISDWKNAKIIAFVQGVESDEILDACLTPLKH